MNTRYRNLQVLAAKRPLLLDGALGSELIRRGQDLSSPAWSAAANLAAPDLVERIHRDYVAAGCDIVTANTFRTTPRAYRGTGLDPDRAEMLALESLQSAVRVARRAAGPRAVAGSLAPLEDCYSPELFPGAATAYREYFQLGTWLQAGDVDLVLVETMGRWEEIAAAVAALEGLKMPFWVSLVLRDAEHLLDGTLLTEVLRRLGDSPAAALLLNCNLLDVTLRAAPGLAEAWDGLWGAYPNLGVRAPQPGGALTGLVSLEAFETAARRLLDYGARILGACCGSGPQHIRTLKNLVAARE